MNVKNLVVLVCIGAFLVGCEGSATMSPMPDREAPKPTIETASVAPAPQPSSKPAPVAPAAKPTTEPAAVTPDAQASIEATTEIYRGDENPKKVDWKGHVFSGPTSDGHLMRVYILYPDDFIGYDSVRRKDDDLRGTMKILRKELAIKSLNRQLGYEWHSAYYLGYEFPPSEDFPLASFINSNGEERTFSTVLPEKGERPSREELDRIRKSRTSGPLRPAGKKK